jgi:hypothetical protein
MKHPSSRGFFTYWDGKRGGASAPDRSDIDPDAVRGLLGDMFVLSYDPATAYPFRFAGTRLCALFGRDVKERSFPALFHADSKSQIEEIITAVAEETLPVVAGLTATSTRGALAHLELLLLPFSARTHTPVSLTGVLAPFDAVNGALSDLRLVSWRYLHEPQKIIPRAIRKLAIARGFMVYEGLR